uniref:Uncharacterized protein n=1 Tax=Arion vulgaris TaxID=1028688 RepID=A0A0B7AMA4_9EUPU
MQSILQTAELNGFKRFVNSELCSFCQCKQNVHVSQISKNEKLFLCAKSLFNQI